MQEASVGGFPSLSMSAPRLSLPVKRFYQILITAICVAMIGAMTIAVAETTTTNSTIKTTTNSFNQTTKSIPLSQAPTTLQNAIANSAPQTLHQLTANYTGHGATFTGSNVSFNVGAPSIGRGTHTYAVPTSLVRSTMGASYTSPRISSFFHPVSAGIEQTFTIPKRLSGAGRLTIALPVSGLTASGSGSTIELGTEKSLKTSYSDLKVIDARGRVLRATMSASDRGHIIAISINDTRAVYPIKVDPTWTESAIATAGGNFGYEVIVSGSTALVSNTGNPYDCGSISVFSISGGTWSQTATISPTVCSNWDAFGASMALDGTTLVVGAPQETIGSTTDQGAVFVFSGSGSSWMQEAEFSSASGTAFEGFGISVAISGSIIAVGSQVSPGNAYVFTGSGSSWTQDSILSASNGTVGSQFGWVVAISGTTVFVGAPTQNDGSHSQEGAVYEFTESGTSWTQAAELNSSDGGANDFFGWDISIYGSTLVVGAPQHTRGTQADSGAAYIFTLSGSAWSQAAELFSPVTGTAEFGAGVAIANAEMVVTAGSAFSSTGVPGIAYVYLGSGSSWSLLSGELDDPSVINSSAGGPGEFGGSVVPDGSTIYMGTTNYTEVGSSPIGAVLAYNANGTSPVGAAPGYDLFGGGTDTSAAECPCSGAGTTHNSIQQDVNNAMWAQKYYTEAQGKKAEPVDTATGDFYTTSNDLVLPGAGLPLEFERTYDAQAAQAEVTASASPGPLGYGWSDNFQESLSYNSGTQVATVTEADGAQTTFSPYSPGSSPAWCTGVTNYCASAPRFEATLNQNGDGSWTYVTYNGPPTTYTFSSAGALTTIADAVGDTLTSATYAPNGGQTPCPGGDTCVAWTSSASGRKLVLASNASAELVMVFDANSSLKATFTYTGSGCSAFSSNPDLCSVTDPGNLVSTYTYDSSNANSDFDYDMLTSTPPNSSGQTINQYNTMGQISEQTDPSGEITTFTYAGTNSSLLGGTTSITTFPNGLSGTQDITVDTYSSNVLMEEATGFGTTDAITTTYNRDPVSLLPISVTDGNGNTTSFTYQTYSGTGGTEISSNNISSVTNGAGNTTIFAYNADNQVYCTVTPADHDNGITCPGTAPSMPPAPGSSDPNLGATIDFYNANDQLTATTDALGNTTTFSYTSGVSGVPDGLLYCTVDPSNYQKSVMCPSYSASHVTGTTTFTYDVYGDETSHTDALGGSTTYIYGLNSTLPGVVSSSTDPDGTVTTSTFNGASEVLSSSATFGTYSSTTLYAYDAYGRKYCEVSPFESAKGVTCPASAPSPPSPGTNPYPGTTIYNYDASGRLVQVTNPLGGVTYNAYDGAGEHYCTVAPVEAALSITCPSAATALTVPTPASDPYLGATILSYDANSNVTQVTNPLGGIVLSTYDADGNVSSTTTESSNATYAPNAVVTYSYTADDQVASMANDSGTTLSYYDPNGNTYCVVSPNAYAAGSATYQCPAWQASWITSPPSPSSFYSSTPSSTQANNVATNFYDANSELIQSTNPDVQTSISTYDPNGNTYCSSDPVNVAAFLTAHSGAPYPYNCPTAPPTTAPTTGSNPGYFTSIYDAADNLLSFTNQLGDTTSRTYDAIGQQLTVTNPNSKVTTYCYYYENASGQCAHGAPASGGTAESLYSTLTPATTADPTGELTTFAHFPGGANDVVVSTSDTTTYNYDANGDQTSNTYSGVQSGYSAPANLSYTFNVDGTTHTLVDATGTTTYGYDANGDITSQALVANAPLSNQTVSYTYYTTGDLATEIYPSYPGYTNPTVIYVYNTTGQISSSTDWLGNAVNYSYDHDGNLTSQANPNSTTTNAFDGADNQTSASTHINQTCGGSENQLQSFGPSGTPSGSRNVDGQLTQYGVSYSATCSGQASLERNYSYDLAGQVIYQGSTTQGANPNNFAYDAASQLTTISNSISGNLNTYTQTFDNAGEVTGQTHTSGTGGLSASYTYDSLGDQLTVSAPSTAYSYNASGQMTSVTTASGTTTYLYSGLGLASSATSPGSPTPSWSNSVDVNAARAFDAVTCTSSTFCVAVGASGYVTVWNGTSWSTPTDADSTRTMDAVTCTSSSFCVAVDTSGYAVIYNGSAWGTPSDIDSTRSVNAISCTSSTFCVAVGASGYDAIYTGSWAAAADIDSTRSMDAVSCVSSTFCVTGDTTGYSAKYTGTWAAATDIDSSRSINSISCASTSLCEAVGSSGYTVTYTGSWAVSTDSDSSRTLKFVACPTASLCVAVDTSGYSTTYNGSSWASATDIDGSRALNALACASATSCVVGDTTGNVLTFNGTAWTAASDVDAARAISGAVCPTSGFCAVVDGSGYITEYAINAQSWTAADVNSSRATNAVTCTSSTFCVAVGASGYVTVWNGTSWSTPTDADSTRTMDAVTCTSSSFCVAVDTSGYAVIYNGSAWGTPSDIDSTRSVNAISCTSSTFCVAVGASGYDAIYTGSWAAAADIDSTRSMDAVSCVSSTFCVTGDTTGYSAKYTGTWAAATDIDSSRSIATISCTSSTFCVTGDTTGYSAKYTGTWSTATDIDSSRSIKNITCESTTFCLSIDTTGYSAKYTGTWAAATDIDNSNSLSALSCTSTTNCVASDTAGNVVTYNGSAWSLPIDADASRSISSLSCTSATACVAVDATGYASIYAPAAAPSNVTSQLTWDISSELPLVIADSAYYYIYGPGTTPVEQIGLASSNPTFLTYTPDSSTWVATNFAGDLVGFWGYDAYGNLNYGTPVSAFGYAGQYTDATSGLSDMRARFYQSQTGAFTTRDPAFDSTDTAYGYADGDGVNNIDPAGLCIICSDPLGIGHDIAQNFDAERHAVAAAGDWTYKEILMAPVHAGEGAYHIYVNIWDAAKDGCSFSSLGALPLLAGLDLSGAVPIPDPEAAVADVADATLSDGVSFSDRQVQSQLAQHGEAFGFTGVNNAAGRADYISILKDHIDAPGTTAIEGAYRGTPVIHYLDTSSGLNVFTTPEGSFWGAWQLSPTQITNVVTHGGLQ